MNFDELLQERIPIGFLLTVENLRKLPNNFPSWKNLLAIFPDTHLQNGH